MKNLTRVAIVAIGPAASHELLLSLCGRTPHRGAPPWRAPPVALCSGRSVNVASSKRYRVFASYRLTCVKCGLVGQFVALEKYEGRGYEATGHLNLYGISSKGEEVVMTVDHRDPVRAGGKNHAENLQCMCYECNHEKGGKVAKEVWLSRALRARLQASTSGSRGASLAGDAPEPGSGPCGS